MSIAFNSSEITITSGSYSFGDIYQEAVNTNNASKIQRLGDAFIINSDLRIKNGASIVDNNVYVTINGDLIQIEKGGLLHLGTKESNGRVHSGCTLNAPNIKLAYGFGCTTKTDSGNLYLYGCIINIYGYWGFFEGTNHVELIENKIDGFGRISGPNSIMLNNYIKKAHGQYGTFATYGTIAIDEGTEVYDSEITSKGYHVATYHNPQYSYNMTVRNGVYDGYTKLTYIESTSGGDTLIFVDSEIRNGYTMERESTNVDFFHKFTFNPIILNADGVPLSNASVVIVDRNGTEVASTNSNTYGQISEEVTYFKSDRYDKEEYLTPHTITVTHGDITVVRTMNIDKPLKLFPFYVVEGGSGGGSGDCTMSDIQSMLNSLQTNLTNTIEENAGDIVTNVTNDIDLKIGNAKNAVIDIVVNGDGESATNDSILTAVNNAQALTCDCVNNRVDLLSTKISQILLAMGEDINETTDLIESHSDIVLIL